MGSKHSHDGRPAAHESTHTTTPPCNTHHTAPARAALAQPPVRVLGLPPPHTATHAPQALLERLGDELPYVSGHRDVYLLYSTTVHGRSFSRLAAAITQRGPTLVVVSVDGDFDADVREGSSGERQKRKCTVLLGGYNADPWLLIAQRERLAKSRAAAAARAEREGYDCAHAVGGAAPQSPHFYGSSNCWVFRADAWQGGVDNCRVSRPKAGAAASNYMYLTDAHPDDRRIGIGMGGESGSWAWFVDKWLEHGSCNDGTGGPLRRCPTFGTLLLAPTDKFGIRHVEVFAVDPVVVAGLADGTIVESAQESILSGDIAADKMILALHERHEFHSDLVDDGDSPCGRT